MKKDVHIYVDYSLANKIESSAKKRRKKISDEYEWLLKQALAMEELQLNFRQFQTDLTWLCKKLHYNTKMLEQLFANLNFTNVDPTKSAKLREFITKYETGRGYKRSQMND